MQDAMQWRWLYNEQQQLAIDTGDGDAGIYCLPYKPQQLVNISFAEQPFDIDDANAYQTWLEALQHYGYDTLPVDAHSAALCAVAFIRFGCPQMPQSWHFQKSDLEQWPAERTLCELNSGFDQGIFLILDIDDEFASCMLLSPSMQVSAIKTLRQYQVMKVLNNRLLPATIDLAKTAQTAWSMKLA
ncbi:cell division protein ZapC [Idiomarina aquatica]|uniref:Cell division protein ZapC n=1 Tax=Idiomarina aquatica TaxID=1327752 RepID=A0A4R6PPP9_9GAMM|nr:cell division protein ZapC domain-containing protein [Idiomarina aquatica]TDP40685.1 cell division protein ZapC [Idiomarina aquatica]